jgi:hypothetical protein
MCDQLIATCSGLFLSSTSLHPIFDPQTSLWIFHARTAPGGLNPFLRTMFFKVLKLLHHPVVPVFVFGALLLVSILAL